MTELRPPILHNQLPRVEVVPHAVEAIARIVRAAIAAKGTALVGFSGAASLHELYANLGLCSSVDWDKVVFFAVDDTLAPGQPARGGRTRQAVDGSFD